MWSTSVGVRVPVMAHVQGVSYLKGRHTFDHYYNFFDYEPYVSADDNTIFEVRQFFMFSPKL